MTQDQAIRIQGELLLRAGIVANGEPLLTYGIWVLPFTHGGIGMNVFLVERAISSEADHEDAKAEATERLEQALARRG